VLVILHDNQRVNVVVRALIFRDDHLLVTQWRQRGVAFAIGGRVEFGESLLESLRREVWEEIGAEVVDHRLLYFSENIFTTAAEVAYHEYGWYFLVETDRYPCAVGEVVPNPDHPDLFIRYLAMQEAALADFWPAFVRRYLPADRACGFTHNPRHIYSREDPRGGALVQEVEGLLVRCS
jgi:8-oxo-dGTP pyrophosphatase MutT (NUDIX family)